MNIPIHTRHKAASADALPGNYEGALWVADWPLVAAELAGEVRAQQAAAICGKHILAMNEGARRAGIRLGMNRREAHSCDPNAILLRPQPSRDSQLFETVIHALHAHVAQLRIGEAGLAFFSARAALGPAQSLSALAESIVDTLACEVGIETHVGYAESSFAAMLAARSDCIIPPGAARQFIASYEIEALLHGIFHPAERHEAAQCLGVLTSLGLRTIGDITSLGAPALYSRFGHIGEVIWHLATCSEPPAGQTHRLAGLPEAFRTFEPPLANAEQAAFASRILAEELSDSLRRHGASGGHLTISALMVSGDEYERTWNLESARASEITDRARWQLSTWMSNGGSGGLQRLSMRMESLQASGESLEPLWGGREAREESAHRAYTRLQALAGHEAVIQAHICGGRTPATCIEHAPWGDVLPSGRADAPWPDSLPAPYPATVHTKARRVDMQCASGHALGVDGYGRCTCSGECEAPQPAFYDGQGVRAWAGPWILEERWWADDGHRRAYLHVAGAHSAWLCYIEAGQWYEEGCYG